MPDVYRLPVTIDPLQLAGLGDTLVGRIDLVQMKRLRPSLYSDEGEVEFRFEFGRDPEGIFCLTGQLTATLQVVCQRCLEPMQLPIKGSVRLGIVSGADEAAKLPPLYEPLIAMDGPLFLAEIIEDELMLALPISPLHVTEVCPGTKTLQNEKVPGRSYPFAALSALKHGKCSN
ncbi:MAG: YceD family protein [Gammaproteobacteria bacterium]|nr:YceD family protein [Gammaproteobacteria bacterium]